MTRVDWTQLKAITTQKKSNLQIVEQDNSYVISLFDGTQQISCTIDKDDPTDADLIDFETNYKAVGNKILDVCDTGGRTIVSPTFEDTQGLSTIWKGHLYTAAPNSLNIFDEKVTTQLKLRGGWYKLLDSTANVGDYVEFSIIDKDNILGLFGMFGLTVGTSVLELKKFVRSEYVSPNDMTRQDFVTGGASEVMAGLYFRTYYLNTGSSEIKFAITEKYHEV
jgi:hypothetical protein